mmetsp:Transcript_1831/g.4262  ORF Transcript_1831/g.4262 Transcript_1831/m.4262 type:complete len:211 (-) Transcript_1831:1148-1780(-)
MHLREDLQGIGFPTTRKRDTRKSYGRRAFALSATTRGCLPETASPVAALSPQPRPDWTPAAKSHGRTITTRHPWHPPRKTMIPPRQRKMYKMIFQRNPQLPTPTIRAITLSAPTSRPSPTMPFRFPASTMSHTPTVAFSGQHPSFLPIDDGLPSFGNFCQTFTWKSADVSEPATTTANSWAWDDLARRLPTWITHRMPPNSFIGRKTTQL